MNWLVAVCANRTQLVDGLADDVEDASESLLPHGHEDRSAGVSDAHASAEAVGHVHGDGADRVLTQVRRDLEDEVLRLVGDTRVADFERRVDLGDIARGEFDIDHWSHDLLDGSCCVGHSRLLFGKVRVERLA